VVKSASGVGAGAQERVRCAMGSLAGRLGGGSGDGSRGENPTLGEGAPPVKSSCRGVAWNGSWTGVGNRSVETAGLGSGLQDGLDDIGWAGVGGEGDTTLGGSCVGTIGQPGIGIQGGWKAEGASKQRLEDVPKVGNGFSLGDACGRRRTSEGIGDKLKAMNDSFLCNNGAGTER
jgi:hypothetical protein